MARLLISGYPDIQVRPCLYLRQYAVACQAAVRTALHAPVSRC